MSSCSLVQGIASVINPIAFIEIVPKVVVLLRSLVEMRDVSQDYLYYRTPNPWL
jgi:hypothetical protein